MVGRAAERAGFAGLQRGAITFQRFNLFFLRAERFDIQVVLLLLFILQAARRQGLFQTGFLGFSFLLTVAIISQLFLQRLVASLQGGEALAHRAQLHLSLNGGGGLLWRQRQSRLRQRSAFLLKLRKPFVEAIILLFIALLLAEKGPPTGNVRTPETKLTMRFQPESHLLLLRLKLRHAAGCTVTDAPPLCHPVT